MTEQLSVNTNYSYLPPPDVKLKNEDTEGLYELLENATADWNPEYQEQLIFAFDIAIRAHANDRHKDRPYVDHVLRVAARILCHMRINDPELIIAAILHDIVEDHPDEIVNATLFSLEGISSSDEVGDTVSEIDKQKFALHCLEKSFTPRVAKIVALVTNLPHEDKPKDYEKKLQAYAQKIQTATMDRDAWVVKFSDWCDNGLSINYVVAEQSDKREHFKRKYGLVLPILITRFKKEDIQAILSPEAKEYVIGQFINGTKRLIE
jgi:(p)ppGpp synthase/HD superfamily hydrolase